MKKPLTQRISNTAIGILIAISGLQIAHGQSSGKSPSMDSFNLNTLLATGQEKQPHDIGSYIIRFINFLSLTIGSFALLAIIIAGVMLVASGGREHPLTRGKDIFKFAIIGLVVSLGAYFITAFVQSIFYDV